EPFQATISHVNARHHTGSKNQQIVSIRCKALDVLILVGAGADVYSPFESRIVKTGVLITTITTSKVYVPIRGNVHTEDRLARASQVNISKVLAFRLIIPY